METDRSTEVATLGQGLPTVRASGGFTLVPRNLVEAIDLAARLANSGAVPKAYLNKPDDILVAMMMGGEVGLKPLQALQNIAVINGNPSLYGDALPALMRTDPDFLDMIEEIGEADATCTLKIRGREDVVRTYTLTMAKEAGLINRDPWQKHRRRMLQMRARSWAIRDAFPHVLKGLMVYEEAIDIPPADPRDLGIAQVVEAERLPPVKADPLKQRLADRAAEAVGDKPKLDVTATLARIEKAATPAEMAELRDLIGAHTNKDERFLMADRWSNRLKQLKAVEPAKVANEAKGPESEPTPAKPETGTPDPEFVAAMEGRSAGREPGQEG